MRLPPREREVTAALVGALRGLPKLEAVFLTGSHARGDATADSDLDLGLLYRESDPFPLRALREIAARVNDAPDPVVSEFYAWGPWVNGGAWLRVRGLRVDLLYRSIEQVERVAAAAARGEFELHAGQQPPYGYFGPTVLGELAACVPLDDPRRVIASLKRRHAVLPEALRRAVVAEGLWAVEFGQLFAEKFAARGDPFGVAGCLGRAVHRLVLVLFALNRTYPRGDKAALEAIAAFERAPRDFAPRVRALLAAPGSTPETLTASVEALGAIFREVEALCDGLYEAPYPVPR